MKTLFFGLFVLGTVSNAFAAFFADLNFDPRFEGTFQSRLICRSDDKSKACKTLQSSYSIVIFNALNHIRITVLEQSTNRVLYRFNATAYDATENELTANAFDFDEHPSAEIQLQYSQEPGKEGAIKGYLRDADFQFDLRVLGTNTLTPAKYYKKYPSNESLVSPQSILGYYTGTWGANAIPLTLNLRKSATSEGFLANTTLPNNGVSLGFLRSHLYQEHGTLTLVAKAFNDATCTYFPNDFMKWTLSIQEGADGSVTLSGRATYSYHPSFSSINLRLNQFQ